MLIKELILFLSIRNSRLNRKIVRLLDEIYVEVAIDTHQNNFLTLRFIYSAPEHRLLGK